jgi:hypothetical protein
VHCIFGSATPAGTAEQIPSRPGSAHDVHVPWQLSEQQTPSVQKPLAQSAAAAQALPRPLVLPLSGAGAEVSAPPSSELGAGVPLHTGTVC